MERSEPTLVPEWLRCTGSVIGGGTSAHHFASSSSQSDVPSSRNRSSRSISDKDSPWSIIPDRSTSSNSRHSSTSNGSTKHPYSSFTRSHRDKNRDREKERSVIRDLWDQDCSDPLGNSLGSRVENTNLSRSQSMVSRKPGEALPRRALELKNYVRSNNQNGVLLGCSTVGGMRKSAFEKDFPSLGTEEKQGVPDIGRVPSPGLSTAVHSLPICNSGLIGGEGWTSALAEVPAIIGSSSMGPTCVQQSVVATPTSAASSAMAGLNMAEALSQAPSRARTTPQLPDKTQRLDELAIKQSRQLIPMTHSTPKPLVVNSTDKSKQPKTLSSQLANQSLRGGQVRSDAPKTSHVGKFLVLKPLWENGTVSSAPKDVAIPTNNASPRLANSQPTVAPSTPTANPRSIVEKKPSCSSQAQSRSDFFNLMRKKTSVNSSAILAPTLENSGGVIKEVVSAPLSPCVRENGTTMMVNGDTHEESRRFRDVGEKNSPCLNGAVYPNEEEAAFLRSLGWEEENGGEDEGLTEEEINAFVQEYMKLRPSLKACRDAQPKFVMLSETRVSNSGGASSESESGA